MKNERGVALVIAVFALTVIGSLVAAAFFAGVQEHRMSDSTRRSHQAFAAAEAQLSRVLRHWPDDDLSLRVYPHDSLVLAGDSMVLRRVGADFYLLVAPKSALGLLVYRGEACEMPHVDRVEMNNHNCYVDTMLQKVAKPVILPSRGLVHAF